jgi:hypothetical protein
VQRRDARHLVLGRTTAEEDDEAHTVRSSHIAIVRSAR